MCIHTAAIRAISDSAIICTTEGVVCEWNRSAVDLLGFPADDVAGRRLDVIFRASSHENLRRWLDRCARGEHLENCQATCRNKSGHSVEVVMTLVPMHGPADTIVGILGILRDVSGQRSFERRFELVVEACPSGIVMVNSMGSISLVNAELERQFGYERTELIGSNIEMLLPLQVRGLHRQHRQVFSASPAMRAMGVGRDLFARRRDGSEFPVEIGLTPIDTGDDHSVLATVVDITSRKQAERAIDLQNAQLRRSNAELEQFAYIASHDLQEPLRMVANFTDLLQERYRDRLDEKGHRYIAYAVDGAKRMQVLVRDLLAYSRVGAEEKAFKPVNSAELAAAIVERLSSAIKDCGARVELRELPLVMSDEVELGQVFQNLLSNALKFRSERVPDIVIDAVRQEQFFRFSVSDNGIGIDPRFSQRIFQMFQRLHERGKYDGSGIGLAIVKKIVARHGGEIWFESTPGAGTTFYFTLPVPPG